MDVPLQAGMIGRPGDSVGAGDQNIRAKKFSDCRRLILGQGVRLTFGAEVLLHLLHTTWRNESHLTGIELRPQTIRKNIAERISILATGKILKTENRDGLARTRGGLLRGSLRALFRLALGSAPTDFADSECCKDQDHCRDRQRESPTFESCRCSESPGGCFCRAITANFSAAVGGGRRWRIGRN